MKILQVHNFYQNPGGEDQVFAAEYDLLRSRGHEVVRYQADNDELENISGIKAALNTFWSSKTHRELGGILRDEKPDLVHAHNTFPLISPSLYYAAEAAGVPVVQTLHNYRLICAGANLFRDGHICEDCVGAMVPYQAVLHRCYRGSLAASAVTASMLAAHRAAGTWRKKINTYIALSDFAKRKFVDGGLPSERIAVKPNFLCADPGAGPGDGDYVLFAGRLCREKGVKTLLDAWAHVSTDLVLKIAGQGPLGDLCRIRSEENPRVQWMGQLSRKDLLACMQRARLLIFPSEYPDPGALTILEAFASSTPVLASDVESLDAYVRSGVNGFRFRAGDAANLAERLQWLFARPDLMADLRQGARKSYEDNYTAERNYKLLMDIYSNALSRKSV